MEQVALQELLVQVDIWKRRKEDSAPDVLPTLRSCRPCRQGGGGVRTVGAGAFHDRVAVLTLQMEDARLDK